MSAENGGKQGAGVLTIITVIAGLLAFAAVGFLTFLIWQDFTFLQAA